MLGFVSTPHMMRLSYRTVTCLSSHARVAGIPQMVSGWAHIWPMLGFAGTSHMMTGCLNEHSDVQTPIHVRFTVSLHMVQTLGKHKLAK